MKTDDLLHVSGGTVVALTAVLSFALGGPAAIPIAVVVVINVYLVLVLIEVARRADGTRKWLELPHRTWALLQIGLVLLALVTAFAALYVRTEGVVHTVEDVAERDGREKTDKKSRVILTDRVDACYFSLVTFTTLGYGDYVPATRTARVVVMWQLASGVLVLLVTLPVVVSRMATFVA